MHTNDHIRALLPPSATIPLPWTGMLLFHAMVLSLTRSTRPLSRCVVSLSWPSQPKRVVCSRSQHLLSLDTSPELSAVSQGSPLLIVEHVSERARGPTRPAASVNPRVSSRSSSAQVEVDHPSSSTQAHPKLTAVLGEQAMSAGMIRSMAGSTKSTPLPSRRLARSTRRFTFTPPLMICPPSAVESFG